MESEQKRRRNGSGILSDPDGLSCDASLGFVVRGNVMNLQAAVEEITPVLKEWQLRTVYRILYPGKLWIKREPVTESTQTEGDEDGDS